jgi:hypothetical protein
MRHVNSLALLLLAVFSASLEAQDFCHRSVDGTATIQLVSQPYGGVRALMDLSEFYGSGASLGAPQVMVAGNQIEIIQSNTVAWPLPTTTCRVYTLDVGPLPEGIYDVSWKTTETLSPPLNPPTRLRIRTLTFALLPASAIPAVHSYGLLLLALTVAGIGMARLGLR